MGSMLWSKLFKELLGIHSSLMSFNSFAVLSHLYLGRKKKSNSIYSTTWNLKYDIIIELFSTKFEFFYFIKIELRLFLAIDKAIGNLAWRNYSNQHIYSNPYGMNLTLSCMKHHNEWNNMRLQCVLCSTQLENLEY